MSKRNLLLLVFSFSLLVSSMAQVVRPKIGTKAQSADGRINIELIGKKQ